MLALFTAIFGFIGPFLPELLKYFNRKLDHAHELAMLHLQMEAAAHAHVHRMKEIEASADIAEIGALRQPQQCFGVQLLDAAAAKNLHPLILNSTFLAFALLDLITGLVRPLVTYAVVGFWLAYKVACYAMMQQVSDKTFTWAEGLTRIWTPDDLAVLTLVLGFWFGQRTARWAFGKSEGAR